MKTRFVLIFMLVLMLMWHKYALSQSIVNKEWEIGFGIPDTIDIAATTIDNYGRIYTAGNTIVPGQNANILTTRYDEDGNIVWQQTYNYSGGSKDYGTCITSDNNGFIYVAGASYINLSHLTDFAILKYDTTGNLIWSTNYNGGNYKIDIPSSIAVDNSGNIYVTGASAGYLTNEDYLTIKLDNNGNVVWNKSYDYAGFNDRPIGIVLDDQDDIIVTGYSELSTNSSEIATIKYDNLNGSQLFVYRYPQIANGINRPESIKKDNLNNIIVSGFEKHPAEGYNIKTIKFDNNLNVIWSKTHDETGNNDKAYSLDIDNQNNIIVCGYASNQNSTKDIITIKYDSNGNELWNQKRTTVDQLGNGEAKKIKFDSSGNSILLCSKTENNTDNILTIKYDSLGNKLWEKELDVTNNDVITDLVVDQTGDVYLSTKQDNNYNSIKYSSFDKPMDPFLDSLGNPLYIKGEIIVRFDSSVVKKQAVDKIDLQYGNLNTFLEDTAILAMKTVLPSDIVDKMVLIKIFHRMTTSDSISISRRGDIVKVPSFWSTFRLIIVREGKEIEYANQLNYLYPIVLYTDLNLVGDFCDVPNDIFMQQSYLEQLSLMPPLYYTGPVNHINMANHGYMTDDAWDFSVGDPQIKVGVFDSGIRYSHKDFGASGTFSNSKIEDGWNYVSNVHPSSMANPDDIGHGTKCAGIIGALRNNSSLIAGIAGGDVQNSNTGVALYDLKIGSNSSGAILSYVIDAIYEGTSFFSLDIFNMSIGYSEVSYPFTEIKSLREQIKFAFNNDICVVTARGTYIGQYSNITDNLFPASFSDNLVIAVGASNSNGNWNNGEDGYVSMYGGDGAIDIVAPGVLSLVKTLDKDTDTDVSNFNGTSASTPHVAGLIGLILSDFDIGKPQDEHLTQEDVEYLLQYTALVKNTPVPDPKTGYGMIDATQAMLHIQPDNYTILHPNLSNYQTSINSMDQNINLYYNYTNNIGENIAAGNYLADIYQVTANGTNSNLGFLSNNYNVIDAWPLLSSSIGFRYYTTFNELSDYDNHIHVDNSDLQNKSVFTSYYYHLTFDYTNNITIDKWIPCNPSDANFDYSVYLRNSDLNVEEISDNFQFEIYPNPTDEYLYLETKSQTYNDIYCIIYDISGKTVYSKLFNSKNSLVELDISDLESSYYLLNV
ncbi:MAG: S8 family serine peptidase, partial [Bacteroidota bacterium]